MTATLPTGVLIDLHAADSSYNFEMHRATDASGTGDTTIATIPGTETEYFDPQPLDGVTRWYRYRHVGLNATPSDYPDGGNWIPGIPGTIDRSDPAPPDDGVVGDGENLAPNPSFEGSSGLTNGAPTGWIRYANGVCSYETSSQFAGAQSLKIVTVGTGGVHTETGFTCTAGDRIYYSAQVKTLSGVQAYVELDFYGASGFIASAAQTTTSASWTKLESTAVVPAGATYFYIYLFLNGGINPSGGTIWFDDVFVQRGIKGSVPIDTQTADLLARSIGGQLFFEPFDVLPTLWTLFEGSNANVLNSTNGETGAAGGSFLRVAGHESWLVFPRNIPYDPSKLYRMRVRWRQRTDPTNGQKTAVFGVTGVAYDGVTFVNQVGANSFSSQHYVIVNTSPTGGTLTWREDVGWFKGVSSTPTSGVSTPDPRFPALLHNDVRFIRPTLVVNYNFGDGIVDIDEIAIDVFDEEAQRRLYSALDSGSNLQSGVKSGVGVIEGGSTFVLYRHREEITALGPVTNTDGDLFVPFAANYQNVPALALMGGQYVTFDPSLGTGVAQRSRIDALSRSTSGFTSRAAITNPGATTAQAEDYTSGNNITVALGTQTLTNSHGVAFDDTYTFHYFISVTVDANVHNFCTATLVVALDVNGTESATFSYSASPLSGPPPYSSANSQWAHEQRAVTVVILSNGIGFRLRAKTFTVSNGGTGSFIIRGGDGTGSNIETYHGLTYNTSTQTTTSAIPSSGDSLKWVATEVI